jgi:hypothetical protein
MRDSRTSLGALLVAVAVTAALTAVVLKVPWSSLAPMVDVGRSVFGEPGASRAPQPQTATSPLPEGAPPSADPTGAQPPSGNLAEPAHSVDVGQPAGTAQGVLAHGPSEQPPAAAASTATPGVTPASEPEPAPPVDYARLNDQVRLVSDTLERFNQKLLRMIAQVRAEQQKEEAESGRAPQRQKPQQEQQDEDEEETGDDGAAGP